jgi:hypothetical protein
MKKRFPWCIIASLMFCIAIQLDAQVGINADGSEPNPYAGLDVKFTNKGFLLPRLTKAEILTIGNPANGLQVFCTTDNRMYIYVSSLGQWKEVAYGTGVLVFSCGNQITINHIEGAVAPVTKTVMYGTVTNIPGELSKCWITSNLGSDHQAIAVNDNAEASAGWYWQFNRKQGYKHDGVTVIPTWTITNINESSDWIPANDPCNIELGNTWRIPTYTEWTNVVEIGGWTDWNGPWNSGLKLHAAGYLISSDGSMSGRGLYGNFWSNTQIGNTRGWFLYFRIGASFMYDYGKVYGLSARCLRE